jgi:hypothetical protein
VAKGSSRALWNVPRFRLELSRESIHDLCLGLCFTYVSRSNTSWITSVSKLGRMEGTRFRHSVALEHHKHARWKWHAWDVSLFIEPQTRSWKSRLCLHKFIYISLHQGIISHVAITSSLTLRDKSSKKSGTDCWVWRLSAQYSCKLLFFRNLNVWTEH